MGKSEGHGFKPEGDRFFDWYDALLRRAKVMAYISTVMYSFNWFLGFCALTWASAVILGGLLTELTQSDYYSVTALLLLEAGRLSTTTFFGKIVTLKLVHGSADPQRLVYNSHAKQSLLGLLGILEQAVQLTVFAVSIVVPIDRLLHLNSLHSAPGDDGFDGLVTSLRIFYVLVLVNGCIATVALMFAKHMVPFFLGSISLRKYYEKIVWKGMDEGLLHATDFELFSWTFEVQADDYRCNTRPSVVKTMYEDLMKFLYYHPKHKGFEAAKVALDSSDTFEREAAANIVGLWVSLVNEKKEPSVSAKEEPSSTGALVKQHKRDGRIASASSGMEVGVEGSKGKNGKQEWTRLLMQTKLLAKLAEALDNDESGRAASYSFLSLARSTSPERVLRVQSEGKGEAVANILMDQIHRLVEMERPKNALTYIKALIPLLDHLNASSELHECMMLVQKPEAERGCKLPPPKSEGKGGALGVGKYCAPAKLGRLKEDMWTIVSEYPRGLKRLQVVAAYVYYLLLSDHERNDEARCKELRDYLRERPQDTNTHILKDERDWLLEVLKEKDLPSTWEDRVKFRLVEEELAGRKIPWLAWRSTALIASLVSLGILLVSSIFIVKYASF